MLLSLPSPTYDDDYGVEDDGFVHVGDDDGDHRVDWLVKLQCDPNQELGGATVHLVEPLPRCDQIHHNHNHHQDHD